MMYSGEKTNHKLKQLTSGEYSRLSGGEKALALCQPLYVAITAKYEHARHKDCPRFITMDEAFTVVDDNNVNESFRLLEDLGLNYIINSQKLHGVYPAIKSLAVYKFQPGAKVLYRTGWDRRCGRPEFFSDSPSLTVDAARWIADQRFGLLGMDTGTPSTESLESHWILLGRDAEIILVENLANLDQLPERFTFIGFPLNLEGRDGSPIRAAALVE
jgi:hypothetical protein